MAFAGAPGGENPSAAYLAGQQHGQQLAAQHAAKPKPTASPTSAEKRAAASVRKPGKPASPPAQTLLQQAQAIAQTQTNAQIAAIKQQQDLYNQQALAKAGQINSATKAAAQLLQNWNLGGQTASSYNQAAQTIGSLAGGFSGQTGVDATNAAAQVQANLANLGAPSGGAKTSTGQVSDPAALQNVLYGLGGFIPGNLLETTGQAQAAVARGLPASLLSYGQNQAAGAVSAGQQQADTLTPQILDAQGKLPQLVQQALSGLSDAQQRAFENKLAIAKYDTGVSEFNAKFNAAQANTAFNQSYKVGQQKISVARLNLDANKFAVQQIQSDRAYKVSLANLGIKQAAAQRAAVAAEYKLANGGYTAGQVAKFNGLLQEGLDTAPPGTSYQKYIAQAVSKGVPVSLAIARANTHWQPGERPDPKVLAKVLGITATAASSLSGVDSFKVFGPEAAQKLGQVTIAAGANRPGANLNPVIPHLVAKIAGVYGHPLTIGTGTNHNEYVIGTHRVSDHWGGDAADIPASGSALTRLGQAALIAMGANPAWAHKQAGGLFNLDTPLGRVQIIFNSMEGGNHYTHLHVGLTPRG